MPVATEAQWIEIKKLHDNGINLIPVRDQDNDSKKAKSPFRDWAKYKTEFLKIDELWMQMDFYKTSAVAMVCGAISGFIENIDIDVKHKPGIDAIIFSDLNKMYPDLFNLLRIDQTPSGGFHLLYRIKDPQVDQMRSYNLASRPATATELSVTPKRPTRCFVELKSEGGLSQMPPSPGYTIYQDRPVPVITWIQRCSIINLIRSYDEFPVKADTYKPSKREIDYYDENPFDHFNGSEKASLLLTDNGWKPYRSTNNTFLYFTHPDSKDGGVHASFNLKTRIYRIFTTSSQFEPDKMYNAATVLSILKHNGDKKITFAYLVSNGYGKIKQYREQSIVKKAALNNKPLPANISSDAITLHAKISAKLVHDNPHGIFWFYSDEKQLTIDRMALYHVSDKLGFMLYNNNLVRVIDNIIHEQQERDFFDTLKNYIKEDDADIYKEIFNSYEAFIERHGKFTISRMPILEREKIINDTKKDCYKFYINTVVHITSSAINQIPYSSITKFIWKKSIHQRDFKPGKTGMYIDFIDKAIGISDFLYQVFGRLVHEYKDEATSYIVALPEKCENPEDGGGAGKNVLCKLFEHITTFSSRSGEQVSYDVKLLQSWHGERLYCISDPPKDFRWSFLKDISTNDTVIKKLFKDEAIIKSGDMPTFIVPTNFGVDIKDGPLRRRIMQLEFTDFFTRAGGVDVHYGSYFPDDWKDEDWAGYDYIMTTAAQKWLQCNGKLKQKDLSNSGWIKQFNQNYGPYVSDFIKENWAFFKESGFITNEQFQKLKDTYITENDINIRYKPTTKKINEALNDWALQNGYTHNKDARDRKQLGEPRGHSFVSIEAPF